MMHATTITLIANFKLSVLTSFKITIHNFQRKLSNFNATLNFQSLESRSMRSNYAKIRIQQFQLLRLYSTCFPLIVENNSQTRRIN